MGQKPSSFTHGVSGTIGTAAQVVPTTKYSIGTSFLNQFGDRYAAITVKTDKAGTLYVFGTGVGAAFSSTADSGVAAGQLLATYTGIAINGTTTTGPDGQVFYVRIAGFRHILPVFYQAAGTDAAVTLKYQTYNE